MIFTKEGWLHPGMQLKCTFYHHAISCYPASMSLRRTYCLTHTRCSCTHSLLSCFSKPLAGCLKRLVDLGRLDAGEVQLADQGGSCFNLLCGHLVLENARALVLLVARAWSAVPEAKFLHRFRRWCGDGGMGCGCREIPRVNFQITWKKSSTLSCHTPRRALGKLQVEIGAIEHERTNVVMRQPLYPLLKQQVLTYLSKLRGIAVLRPKERHRALAIHLRVAHGEQGKQRIDGTFMWHRYTRLSRGSSQPFCVQTSDTSTSQN